MSQIAVICLLSLGSFIAYIFSVTPLAVYTPQFIALISIITLILIKRKSYLIFSIALLINVIIFTSNGLNSPFFFLVYFLLFVIAFQNPPTTTLSYSLILVILLSQSLNSYTSLIPLISLLFITPLAWFIGRQYLDNLKLGSTLAYDETEILFWLTLKFKTGICQIIDSASQLLSQPQLSPSQKQELHHIKDSAKNLLNSSQKLTQEIDQKNNEA